MTAASACGWSVTETVIVGSGADGSMAASTTDSADGTETATPEAPGCTAWWSEPGLGFDVPVVLEALSSSANEADPRLSRDGLVLTFASDRPGMGGYDFYRASRVDAVAPFEAPVALAELGSAFDDTALSPAEDGVDRFFASSRGNAGSASTLWQVKLEPTLELAPLTTLDAAGDNYDPFLTRDGRSLYWTVDADDDMNFRVAHRDGPAAPFEAAGGVSFESPAYDDSLTFSDDGLVAVWGSERVGGAGEHDLWFATRASPEAAFGAPAPVPTVNSAVQDREGFITHDGCALYFASDRVGGQGGWDLYVAHARLE